jgi:hypothetical protein
MVFSGVLQIQRAILKDAANVSPSPWGEGRDEGERLNHSMNLEE